ncbi:ATP-dependent RecD-like DNA helicase [Brochothrix campestris]|uniref:SF1B family DNA helicase RecD2 n=1 Tax=Brochothrix campestris TaxID=2757 RepID=UPI0038D0C66A
MVEQSKTDAAVTEPLYVKGNVVTTIFHNATNLFSVLRLEVKDSNVEWEDREIVVTGYLPQLSPEERYHLEGTVSEHPKYGRQFQVTTFKKELPATKAGVASYLSSDMFKGVGKKTAEKIVDVLGNDAISRILQDATVLDQVPKLTAKLKKTLAQTLQENEGLELVMIKLNEMGFGPQLAMRIFQTYQQKTLEVINENPFQLIHDVAGIGFGRADELGQKIGMGGNHPARLSAALMFTVDSECMQNGHVYLEYDETVMSTKRLLVTSDGTSIAETEISDALQSLLQNNELVQEETRIYLPSLYHAEKGVAHHLLRLQKAQAKRTLFEKADFLKALGELEERINVAYAPSQSEAIETALNSATMILTGGPGTGKTTVIKGIVELFAELNGLSLDPSAYKDGGPAFPVVLAAPTGRAAKRMSESTNLPAMTIHRLLGMTGQENKSDDVERELEGQLLIIDESSMVDIWLANQLLRSVPTNMQVIFVGDKDQLPSVGPGQFLKDILASAALPTISLTDIYRQAEGSSIIELAHHVKEGVLPADFKQNTADRSFFHCNTQQLSEVVGKVVKNAAKKGFTAKDIQVLIPLYRGPAGITKMNEELQAILNPNPDGKRKEIQYGDVLYRVGDKVLQLVNQPESNVFNGDMGTIVSIIYAKETIEKQDTLVIEFDQTEVTYLRGDLNQITHAYCCSVHKAQGSEFPIVILPMLKSYYRMLRRDILYTAMTRSRQFLIMCGEESAFEQATVRQSDISRHTSLLQRLTRTTAEPEPVSATADYILTPENVHTIDPMIGMTEVEN